MQRERRKIKDGREYDHLFRSVSGKHIHLDRHTNAYNTLGHMHQIAYDDAGDTAKLSPLLQRSTHRGTCEAIWNFCVDYINYKPDHPDIEQVRSPARTWADREEGVDCDCFSVFVSSILLNLHLPHSFRIADYGNGWQHVYVVAPDPRTGILRIIDPVLDRFDQEQPPRRTHDHIVMKIEKLDGPQIMTMAPYQTPHYNQSAAPVRVNHNNQPISSRNTPLVYDPRNQRIQSTPQSRQQAFDQMVRQAQDSRAMNGRMQINPRNAMMGLGNTQEPAKEPGFFQQPFKWMNEHPAETGLAIVGTVALSIAAYQYLGPKKKKKRSVSGLDGTNKKRSKAAKNRPRNSKGQFVEV